MENKVYKRKLNRMSYVQLESMKKHLEEQGQKSSKVYGHVVAQMHETQLRDMRRAITEPEEKRKSIRKKVDMK